MLPEFPGRVHLQTRVRVHGVEVLEGRRQLVHYGGCVGQVHQTDVVALEGVDEALGHAVALRAADRRVRRLEAQLARNAACVVSDVGAAVVREELQRAALGKGFHDAEALLYGLDENLTHRLAWQAFGGPCAPSHDLAVAAVLDDGCVHSLDDSQLISKPSEHQRTSLAATGTLPS